MIISAWRNTKADQEEEKEDVKQEETQSSHREIAGLSQQSVDCRPFEISSSEVWRCERGWNLLTRYSKSEYIMLTEDGELESF